MITYPDSTILELLLLQKRSEVSGFLQQLDLLNQGLRRGGIRVKTQGLEKDDKFGQTIINDEGR